MNLKKMPTACFAIMLLCGLLTGDPPAPFPCAVGRPLRFAVARVATRSGFIQGKERTPRAGPDEPDGLLVPRPVPSLCVRASVRVFHQPCKQGSSSRDRHAAARWSKKVDRLHGRVDGGVDIIINIVVGFGHGQPDPYVVYSC